MHTSATEVHTSDPEQTNKRFGRTWNLPHYAITHPQKPGKVRVVYDCAAKSHGVSLNDHVLQGPDFVNDLDGVPIRF